MNKLFKICPVLLSFTVNSMAVETVHSEKKSKDPYNFLFIAIDDLNDWTGFLGGHPQTKTPNMDRLAKQGVVFERAYCAASVCNPSRASLLTGYRPSTTGIYNNNHYLRDSEVLKDVLTLPQWLAKNGYYTMARGKIFHSANGMWSDQQSWNLQEKASGGYGKTKKKPGLW